MISVRAASRIHFGLLAFGASAETVYGGAGLMVEDPWLEVFAEPSDTFAAAGPHAERLGRLARSWSEYFDTSLPDLRLSTQGPMRDHVGMGFGTQLGLAVARVLCHAGGITATLPQWVASVRRGKRSAVGSHGFVRGGFLFEPGQSPEGDFPPLQYHRPVPQQWRVLLATQRGLRGCHGEQENQGFAGLPPVPREVTAKLRQLIEQGMIPALEADNCRAFGEAVYQYGYEAGGCYLPIQGARYAGPVCCRLVEQLRRLGIAGVGQSSWGPTIFGICANAAEAEEAAQRLRTSWTEEQLEIRISPPANRGATLYDTATTANLNPCRPS